MPYSRYWFLLFFLLLSFSTTIAAPELDLREANVMGVKLEQIDTITYRFNVTLFHDDDGEEGYADFWIVETLNGTELGKRLLTHAHGSQEFARSGTIIIPESNEIVVIRGHDQTHGFGGQAILINLQSGKLEIVVQGDEPMDFSNRTIILPQTTPFTTMRDVGSISGFEIVPLLMSTFVVVMIVIRKRKNSDERINDGN
ncbi:MAG: hypothetical protein ACXADY_19360 [Candidatus Hodarchaeales archaeon]